VGAGEGLFEAVDGCVRGVGPVSVVDLGGKGGDGSRRLLSEFVVVVEGGFPVLFFVKLCGCASLGEVCLAFIEFALHVCFAILEFTLQVCASVQSPVEGSGRGELRSADSVIALGEFEFVVCDLSAELGTLRTEPSIGRVGAFIFGAVSRAPAKNVLVALEEFGGDGVGW
jgi:hypothetical protein